MLDNDFLGNVVKCCAVKLKLQNIFNVQRLDLYFGAPIIIFLIHSRYLENVIKNILFSY